MRSSAAVWAVTLLLWPAYVHAEAQVPERNELAKTLVEVGDERQHEAKALEPMESLLAGLIASKLSLRDPSETAKVKTVVHEALTPVAIKAGDAMADAYSTNFSARELSGVLAFMKSSAAQAEKTNLPVLKSELGAAMAGVPSNPNIEADADRVFGDAPLAKRELVLRILKAQDFEAHTRKGYAALGAVMKNALQQAGANGLPSKQQADLPTGEDEQAADNYVRLVMAIEKRYYVNHFSDGDLAAVAAYLESDAGQAIITRMPIVQRTVGKVLRDQLVIAIGSLDKNVCAAVPCTAEQRASVSDFARTMAASIPSAIGVPG